MRQKIFILLICCITVLFSQENKQQQAAKLPDGFSEFDFIIGEWDIDIDYRMPNGEMKNYQANWTCEWMINGWLLHQDWKGPYTRGSEFKTYNPQTGKWEGYHIYWGREWSRIEGENVGDEIILFIEPKETPNGTAITKEVYYEISENSFKMKAERSYDDGETYTELVYDFTATRKN